jgi:hypothetical protein
MRFSVEVTHSQNCCQGLIVFERVAIVAVIELKGGKYEFGGRTSYNYSHDTLYHGYEGCFTSRDPGWRSVRKRKVLF